jgi:DNA-directed RNA polymerase subunit M/transcription elongation factor TFIIS
MSKQFCPKCGSLEVEQYDDLQFLRCKKCGYDELAGEELPYDVKKSQREKTRYNPYKVGGKGRVRR